MLTAAAQALAGIAGLTKTARRDTDAALVRLDAAVASLSPTEVPLAQRLSRQLHGGRGYSHGRLAARPGTDPGTAPPAPRRFNPVEGAADTREFDLKSPISRHAVRLSGAAAAEPRSRISPMCAAIGFR